MTGKNIGIMRLRSQIPPELLRMVGTNPALKDSYLVGGSVRDAVAGRPILDFDVEVFGVPPLVLESELQRYGRVDKVGKSFGIMKLQMKSGLSFDFSLPRLDSKYAPGHRGFSVQLNPNLTAVEAASRRDFTINSLMYHINHDRLLDFFGGIQDIRDGVLRHVGPAFSEDPLRVLRGFQFAARFGLKASKQTVSLCRSMAPMITELPVERVCSEWMKWAGQSVYPSLGLRFLAESGWLAHFPEIHALTETPQDPVWHPEGNVFEHTCLVCDAMASNMDWRSSDLFRRQIWMFAALLHDAGKPEVTVKSLQSGQVRITSPRHEKTGLLPANVFMSRIGLPKTLIKHVLPLVSEHMIQVNKLSESGLRRLAKRLEPESVRNLCVLLRADTLGRSLPAGGRLTQIDALENQAKNMYVSHNAQSPILKGRHLLSAGLEPGRIFARILKAAYECQIDGQITDEDSAINWLRNYLDSNNLKERP